MVLSLLGGCSSVERSSSKTVPSYASLSNGRDPLNPDQYSELDKRFAAKGGLIPTLEDLQKTAAQLLSANMEWMLLRAYALSQAHRYQFKLMKIPESVQIPTFLILTRI